MGVTHGLRHDMQLGAAHRDPLLTARTGRGKFYAVEHLTAKRVQGRVHVVIILEPYDSVTLSISVERVHQLLDILERVVSEE